jgi:hypothetical protein
LDKLREFHRSHVTLLDHVVQDMEEAFNWLPKAIYATEAEPLRQAVRKKTRGANSLGDLLLPLLLRLGVRPTGDLKSDSSEARGSD